MEGIGFFFNFATGKYEEYTVGEDFTEEQARAMIPQDTISQSLYELHRLTGKGAREAAIEVLEVHTREAEGE